MTAAPDSAGDGEWQRVLWKPQPFPDNYVPPSFLSSLITNQNVHRYNYWSLVLGACTISQHLSAVFIFLAIFTRLLDQTLDPRLLVALSTAIFVGGLFIWELMEHTQEVPRTSSPDRRASCGHIVKGSLLLFLALMALAPILRTLTAPTSADSIWALATALFLVHASLADYSYTPSPQQRFFTQRLTSVLSINAAISAVVVLASRLHEDLAVFSLMLFSVEVFALFPILRRRIQSAPAVVQCFVTVVLGTMALAAPLPALCAIVLLSVVFGAPAALMWAQQHKNEIRGPWDTATPRGFMRDYQGGREVSPKDLQ
ncbi:phosphatidylinositol N-acetylglucosaminyltransferase [Gloeopeniophorella convolvens]|nr:phosphatidylinositol N-acetylglucosaminyltransferase [Gloeopeniophorella convolvens]